MGIFNPFTYRSRVYLQPISGADSLESLMGHMRHCLDLGRAKMGLSGENWIEFKHLTTARGGGSPIGSIDSVDGRFEFRQEDGEICLSYQITWWRQAVPILLPQLFIFAILAAETVLGLPLGRLGWRKIGLLVVMACMAAPIFVWPPISFKLWLKSEISGMKRSFSNKPQLPYR